MKKVVYSVAVAALLSGCFGGSTAIQEPASNVAASTSDVVSSALTNRLVQELGITPAQASGGAGSLFQVAKAGMQANDFSHLVSAVPEVSHLIGAAPKKSGWSQVASGTSAIIGDKNDTLGQAAALAENFKNLGLSTDMISQFTPIISDYVKQEAGNQISKALLSSLAGL
jgi:hypothetical protein